MHCKLLERIKEQYGQDLAQTSQLKRARLSACKNGYSTRIGVSAQLIYPA